MIEIKGIKLVLLLLVAVGVIFGTFSQFAANIPLGFIWFVNMLWFVIGFSVLLLIAYVFLDLFFDFIETEKETVLAKVKKD